MPIIRSAKKALRQNIRRQGRNLARKKALHDIIKKYKKSVSAKQSKEAGELLPRLYQALDKAVKANLIKRNKARRLKSRLAQLSARASRASS